MNHQVPQEPENKDSERGKFPIQEEGLSIGYGKISDQGTTFENNNKNYEDRIPLKPADIEYRRVSISQSENMLSIAGEEEQEIPTFPNDISHIELPEEIKKEVEDLDKRLDENDYILITKFWVFTNLFIFLIIIPFLPIYEILIRAATVAGSALIIGVGYYALKSKNFWMMILSIIMLSGYFMLLFAHTIIAISHLLRLSKVFFISVISIDWLFLLLMDIYTGILIYFLKNRFYLTNRGKSIFGSLF